MTQRFDIQTSASGDLRLAIKCVDIWAFGDIMDCMRGTIVIRAYNHTTNEPGEVLAEYGDICPRDKWWYGCTSSHRVTLPAKYKRVLFIGYKTPAQGKLYSTIGAAGMDGEPKTDNFMWTSVTNEWEDTSDFYAHYDINADIVIP